jgi:MATE family multidrug resistance protein
MLLEVTHNDNIYFQLLLISLFVRPMALSILARIGMGVTDLAVLGHYSTDSLSAAAAALVWINVTSQFLYRGFHTAINIMGSQALGAGNPQLCGLWFQQGLLLSCVMCIPVGASWLLTGRLLKMIGGLDDGVCDMAQTFANYSLLWLLPLNCYSAMEKYFQALEIVRPALLVNMIGLLLNLGLNLLLIHGIDLWGMSKYLNY